MYIVFFSKTYPLYNALYTRRIIDRKLSFRRGKREKAHPLNAKIGAAQKRVL